MAAVVANAHSSSGGPTTLEHETDGEHMNIVVVDCTADSQKYCRRIWRSNDGTEGWGRYGEGGGGYPPGPGPGPSDCHCICTRSST